MMFPVSVGYGMVMIPGEVAEWLKALVWSTSVRVIPHRGFESRPLRLQDFSRKMTLTVRQNNTF